jgi:hypothetical protein
VFLAKLYSVMTRPSRCVVASGGRVFAHPAAAPIDSPIWGVVVKYPRDAVYLRWPIAVHVVTATIKFTGILLVMMRPSRLSGHAAAVFLRRLESSTWYKGQDAKPRGKLGLEGIVSTECALSLRSVEIVDKSQKPEGTRRNSRYRWHLLTLGFPASNLVLERTKG